MRAPADRSIHKVLGRWALGRRPQGRLRMRWVENVLEDALSWESGIRRLWPWIAVDKDIWWKWPYGSRPCSASRVKVGDCRYPFKSTTAARKGQLLGSKAPVE